VERVEFSLGFSKILTIFLLGFCLATLLIISYLPIPVFLRIAGVALLIIYGWVLLNLHISRKAKRSVIKIWQDPKGRWGCQTVQGHRAVGVLAGESFISAWVLVLHFRFKTRIQNVIIPVDALRQREYQILSTRIRFFH